MWGGPERKQYEVIEMKALIVALLAVVATAPGRAGPTERVILAAMKVSELPNYSWTSVVVDDARTYQIYGKTRQGGFTWVRMPMVVSIARRLGPHAGSEIEAIFRGNERCVIHTSHGWQTLAELPVENFWWTDADEWRFSHPTDSTRLARSVRVNSTDISDPSSRFRSTSDVPINDRPDEEPLSNAQFGVSHPHEELGVIVGCLTAATGDGEVVTGAISSLGAALLLVRDGQEDITPLSATGTFRLVIKDGIVERYSLRLEGLLQVSDDRVHVRQYSSTVLSDMGKTRVDPPEEAREKLGPGDGVKKPAIAMNSTRP
jgi:hypothetical protein